MTTRHNNPDRLDDGARAEAEMKEREAGSAIADAVLSWMVKYDLLDAGNEYHASDVLAVLNDLVPSSALPAPQGDDTPISAQDPLAILAGIKQFGLAPDGCDLRDLEAAIVRLARPSPPQGDDTLVERLNELRLKAFKSNDRADMAAYYGVLSVAFQNDELVPASALRSQAAEIAGLKAAMAQSDAETDMWASSSRQDQKRAESAESRLASAMEALTEARKYIAPFCNAYFVARKIDAALSSIKRGEAE